MIGQIVLRWDRESLRLNEPSSPSKEYLDAMHCLIKRIAQVQSAHEQPQGPITDPEILLPLVLQEAQAVLQQLPVSGANLPNAEPPALLSSACWKHPVQPLRTLASWLLWSIAQATHDTMQLLEGVPAQVSADRQIWHSGIVRLAACLEVKTAQTPFSLDLVTFQAAPSGLPEEDFVQIQACLLGQQIISVKALLQRLLPQLTSTAAILQPFLAGFPIELLVPHQAWQFGEIKLRLVLEFIPTQSLPSLAAALPNSLLDPLPTVRFTDPVWLEQHITTVVEDQLTQVLVQQPMPTAEEESEQLIAIICQGCVAIEQLQCSLTLASRTFAQQVFSLDELALQLLWGLNRSAYEVMQWLSGMQVRLLQPQQGWTTGTLRLGAYLLLRTPEQTWCFDLVQRCLSSANQAISDTAVVQWLGQDEPKSSQLLLSELAANIRQKVSQTMPEILLLHSETEVNVMVANSPGQLGIIQLQTAFEFTASESFEV